jgi:ketosteroid isomerase-like protein
MATAHNAAVVRRAVEAIWNRGELDVADALFSADYVNHHGLIPDLVRGPEAIKISVALYRTAFPNLHVTVEDLIAEGETVVLRWTARNPLPEPAAESARSDARGALTGVFRSRLAGGRIVESWTYWDRVGVLERLGLTRSGGEMPGGGSRFTG